MDRKFRYDIKSFSDDLGLGLDEVSILYSELIGEINSEISKLKVFLSENDRPSIRQSIHNLKGLSGNYRIFDLYELTAAIYDDLKYKNPDEIRASLQNLFATSESAVQEIREFFRQNGIDI